MARRGTFLAYRGGSLEGLDDRLQEAWDPLLAIADLAGPDWSERARKAATALAGGAEDASEPTHGHVLIEALRSIFGDTPAMSSRAICEKLNADEELPFGGYSDGAGIKPRDLAKLLKPYGIKSKDVWAGGKTAKGYRHDDFSEAWQRYAPPRTTPVEEGQEGQEGQDPIDGGGFDGQGGGQGVRDDLALADDLALSLAHENPDEQWDLADLALLAPAGSPPRAEDPSADGPEPARRRSTIDFDALRGVANNGAGPAERSVADLSDDELLATFPGSAIERGPELESEPTPCACRQRAREWRLAGEALDVSSTYVSNRAHREAVEQGAVIISKGKRSGWSIETLGTGHGHPWTCALCHPPADGVGVEYRDASPEAGARRPESALRWRPGYGWRRDHEPDGDPLPPEAGLSDEAFLRKVGGSRLVREWQLKATQEAVRAGDAEEPEA